MIEIAKLLRKFLAAQLAQRIGEAGVDGRVQPVLVATSHALLDTLWVDVTSDGSRDWPILVGAKSRDIAVLLIEDNPPYKNGDAISARATWDYAVAVRNSNQPCLILASARAWDGSQESIVQASEQLWLEATSSLRSPSQDFWAQWEGEVEDDARAGTRGDAPGLARQLLDTASVGPSGLKGRDEDRLWHFADAMLLARSREELVARAGLIEFEPGTRMAEVAKTLAALGKATRESGLAVTEAMLQGATREPEIQAALRQLFSQVSERSGTGAAFEADMHAALANHDRAPWREVIGHSVLKELLRKSGIEKPSGKLELSLDQAVLNPGGQGAPKLIRGMPTFQVSGGDGNEKVFRIEQGRRIELVRHSDGSFAETSPLLAARTTRYQAESGLLSSKIIHIVDMETFTSGAVGWAGATAAFKLPSMKKGEPWRQQMMVTRPGYFGPTIIVPRDATLAIVEGWDDEPIELTPAAGLVDLPPGRVEHHQEIVVRVSRPGQADTSLSIVFEVDAVQTGSQPGMVQALLKQHFSGAATLPLAIATPSPAREA